MRYNNPMNLMRSPLLIEFIAEGQPVPVNWPTKVGYPPPGITRKTAYPAGMGKGKKGPGVDDEYPCTKEGKKFAKSHAWLFPSKRVKACGKTYRT